MVVSILTNANGLIVWNERTRDSCLALPALLVKASFFQCNTRRSLHQTLRNVHGRFTTTNFEQSHYLSIIRTDPVRGIATICQSTRLSPTTRVSLKMTMAVIKLNMRDLKTCDIFPFSNLTNNDLIVIWNLKVILKSKAKLI